MKSSTISDKVWTEEIGNGPLMATDIHDGHDIRPEVARPLALDEAVRLREEGSFTREWTAAYPTRKFKIGSGQPLTEPIA